MPEGQRRASTEAALPDTAAEAGSGFARPEEVSAFRMTRRKRSSSVKAPAEAISDKGPVAAAKAAEPAAPASSPTDLSDDDVSSKPGAPSHLCSAQEQCQAESSPLHAKGEAATEDLLYTRNLTLPVLHSAPV